MPVSTVAKDSLQPSGSFMPQCLEFNAALALAAAADPQVLKSIAREYDYEARLTEAKALRRPVLSAFGRSGVGDTSVIDNAVSNQIGLQLSQRVFDFGDARLARKAAEAEIKASQFDTNVEKRNAAQLSGLAYLSALEASEKLNLTRERRTAFKQQLEVLDRLLDAGGATLTERATVASEIADAEVFAFELELIRESALISLRIATGKMLDPCAGTAGRLLETADPAPNETAVLSYDPELNALRRQVDALSAQTMRQERSRLPVLSVVATGSYASIGGFDTFEYRDRIGIDVSVPLYSGNALRAATQRARSREQQARNNLLIAERNLRRTLQTAQTHIVILQRQLTARKAATEQKQRLLEAARREQEAGTLTVRELTEIRIDYENAKIAEISTKYDLARQYLELKTLQSETSF